MKTPLFKINEIDDLLHSHCSLEQIENQLSQLLDEMEREEMIVVFALWIYTLRGMARKMGDKNGA